VEFPGGPLVGLRWYGGDVRPGAGAVAISAASAAGRLLVRTPAVPGIKTVAIIPFDNQNSELALTKDVNDAITDAIQGRLGLRSAAQSNADAVVRGRVVHYDANVPVAFQPGVGRADVTQRQVQITVDVQIVNQKNGKTLWQRQGLLVVGEYTPPQEAQGRKVALQKLENDIVDGAQSQW
jgi:hypothetical protein